MSTSVSKSSAYAVGADLRARHDFRQLGDLIGDAGSKETNTSTFDAHANTVAALYDAAGMIEAACLQGGIYSVTDLGTTLSGVSKQMLVKLNCELAFWNLWTRRHPDKQMPPVCLWAFDQLDKLQKGERIFSLQENIDAGHPEHDYLTEAVIDSRGEITDQSRRYHGVRAKIKRMRGGPYYGGNADDR